MNFYKAQGIVVKEGQTVERHGEITVGTSLYRIAPTERFDNAYHKIDFIRDRCWDSGTARLANVVVSKGRIFWKASLRLLAIADERPK